MRFTKILCPIDFSEGSQDAMWVAIRIAKETGAELVLANVWYMPPSAYSLEAPFPPYLVQEVVDDAQTGLDAAIRQASADGVKQVSGALLTGTPWAQIVDLLDRQAFDLCVISTHGRTGLARILLGSVTEKVVRHAPCSVLVVRPNVGLEPFKHVLVPTDFSESAEHAADVGSDLVAPGGTLSLLHVIEMPVAHVAELPIADFMSDLDARAAETLAKDVARLKTKTQVAIKQRSTVGYPGAQILAALDQDPTVDLVVMGSHGRTGIKRVLMGSVAEKVVRNARCPVLVARTRG